MKIFMKNSNQIKKIVHMCMTAFTDGMAYQENLLTKYHAKLGYAVTVITSTWQYNTSGNLIEAEKQDYINQDNVHVIRLKLKGRNNITRKFRRFRSVYSTLCSERPDILFIHGCQYLDILEITKYIKEKNVKQVYVDNHADLMNSATTWLSKEILHKVIWRYCVKTLEPYIDMYYGVLPKRVLFLHEMYGISDAKCKLLRMGADDEYVKSAENNIDKTKKRYGVKEDKFIIVTGGKINSKKRQIILLQKAVQKLNCDSSELFIFGSLSDDIREEILSNCRSNITYVGWLSSKETHDLIAIADLAVYPSGHSTLWEQTAGQGIPMLLNYWGGVCDGEMKENVEYLYECTEDEIYNKLESIIIDKNKYIHMKNEAGKCQKEFLYSSIAKHSIMLRENE